MMLIAQNQIKYYTPTILVSCHTVRPSRAERIGARYVVCAGWGVCCGLVYRARVSPWREWVRGVYSRLKGRGGEVGGGDSSTTTTTTVGSMVVSSFDWIGSDWIGLDPGSSDSMRYESKWKSWRKKNTAFHLSIHVLCQVHVWGWLEGDGK